MPQPPGSELLPGRAQGHRSLDDTRRETGLGRGT
ncbi:hypothetical protein RCH21_003460, partial [Arthrobacter sp. PL16]|nr:hypothetical protein [Arthrobacter sp. PL16]